MSELVEPYSNDHLRKLRHKNNNDNAEKKCNNLSFIKLALLFVKPLD